MEAGFCRPDKLSDDVVWVLNSRKIVLELLGYSRLKRDERHNL
jgi:hypothetical protein